MAEAPHAPRPLLDATGARKAAVLMVLLDSESAARLMGQLDKAEQERIAMEIVRLEVEPPDQEERDRLLREFYNLFHVAQQYVDVGGAAYARQILEKIHSGEEVRRILETIESSMRSSPFVFLQKADTENLVNFIKDEHPQTVALILAHLGPSQAAAILEGLAPQERQEVVTRLATMEHTNPDIVKEVEKALENKLSSFVSQEFRKSGGVQAVAEILNLVPRSTERAILEGLSEKDPRMAEEIRHLMFTFEDLLRVNDRGIQNLLRNIHTSQLALALKHASPEIKDKFFTNMSKRASELVREEIEFMGPVRLTDVEAAQQAIVDVVRRLEEQGEVVIEGRGGAEEVVV